MRHPSTGFLVFASALAVFALCLNGVWSADHSTSLLQLDYSLWADHSVVLGREGQFQPQSVDDFLYMGGYYSALAPGTSVLALPFAALGFALDGGFTLYGDTMLLTELFVAICNAVAAYLVFKLGRLYFREKTSVLLACAYAFSTISWPFAVYFFQSDVSAMLDVAAAYMALRFTRDRPAAAFSTVPCGAALGLAITVDYVNLALVPVFLLFFLFTFRKGFVLLAKVLAGLIIPVVVGLGTLALYNQAAFADPLVTTEQAFQHTNSIFASFSYPLLQGLYLDLLSPLRGLFVYCPILIFGAIGFYFILGRRETVAEGVFLVGCFLAILIPYSMWTDAVGGEAFGPRFLVSAIPFLLLPAGFLVEKGRRGLVVLAYGLYAAGVVLNGMAAVTTSIPQVEAISEFPFLTSILPRFVDDMLDTWWWRGAGPNWWIYATLIIEVALLLPEIINALTKSRDERGPRTPPVSSSAQAETAMMSSHLKECPQQQP